MTSIITLRLNIATQESNSREYSSSKSESDIVVEDTGLARTDNTTGGRVTNKECKCCQEHTCCENMIMEGNTVT